MHSSVLFNKIQKCIEKKLWKSFWYTCCKILFIYVDYSLDNQCWFHSPMVTSEKLGLIYWTKINCNKHCWINYILLLRKVWRYQRGNQNPYIEEEQTTQWPKEKVQKDKQRSTKHTYKKKWSCYFLDKR